MKRLRGNYMRRWKSSELEKKVQERMPAAKISMLSSGRRKTCRRRPRNKDEQDVLDLLCIRKWENALASGKVKKLSRRKWYYEFD